LNAELSGPAMRSAEKFPENLGSEKAGEIESKEFLVFLEHKPAAARLIWIPQQAKSNSIQTGC
jgi:hypothetical protein